MGMDLPSSAKKYKVVTCIGLSPSGAKKFLPAAIGTSSEILLLHDNG